MFPGCRISANKSRRWQEMQLNTIATGFHFQRHAGCRRGHVGHIGSNGEAGASRTCSYRALPPNLQTFVVLVAVDHYRRSPGEDENSDNDEAEVIEVVVQ